MDCDLGQEGFDLALALFGAHGSGVLEFWVTLHQSVQHGAADVAG